MNCTKKTVFFFNVNLTIRWTMIAFSVCRITNQYFFEQMNRYSDFLFVICRPWSDLLRSKSKLSPPILTKIFRFRINLEMKSKNSLPGKHFIAILVVKWHDFFKHKITGSRGKSRVKIRGITSIFFYKRIQIQ